MEKIFDDALEQFSKQFGVEMEAPGYYHDYEENDGVAEIEFWIEGLIQSNVAFFPIEVSGWFSHDHRDEEDIIYCLLVVEIDGKVVGDCEGIQATYDVDTEKWKDLRWDQY